MNIVKNLALSAVKGGVAIAALTLMDRIVKSRYPELFVIDETASEKEQLKQFTKILGVEVVEVILSSLVAAGASAAFLAVFPEPVELMIIEPVESTEGLELDYTNVETA